MNLKEVLKLPPSILFKRVIRKVNFVVGDFVRERKARWGWYEISDRGLQRFLGETNFFKVCRESKERLKGVLEDIDGIYGDVREDDVKKIYSHTFSFLGSGEVSLGEKINWHIDFKSGYIFNSNLFRRKILHNIPPEEGVDIKVPWELSRFQHIPLMGKAFLNSNDRKLLKEFMDQINSWIDENPVYLGVNWACPMDVAIRAINWILGFFYFWNGDNEEFWKKFTKSLINHARFIRSNLEWNDIGRSNHYLSNIAGLAFLGLFFWHTKEGKRWAEFSYNACLKEMEHQVYKDGVDHEGSIAYHHLVTEIFCWTTKALEGCGFKFPSSYWKKLKKMFFFIACYTKPSGAYPQIGDNDDGRVVILRDYFNRDLQDHTHLFDEFKNYCKGVSRMGTTQSFPHGGFYIIRDDEFYAIIRCGPVGIKGIGGHGHNDQLSFEIEIDRCDIFVDSGTYIYTPSPKERNTFRSTSSHNTIMVEGQEQNPIIPHKLFYLEDSTRSKCLKWDVSDKEVVFQGEHFGYIALPQRVIHRRQIVFSKEGNVFYVTDELLGEGSVQVSLFLNVHPHRKVKVYEDMVLVSLRNCSFCASFENLPKDWTISIEDSFYSPSYGVKMPSQRVKIEGKAHLPFSINWKMYKTGDVGGSANR